MIIKINELKAKSAAKGKRVTLADIVNGTGINRRTLDNLIAGKQMEIRADYLDALAAFFGVTPNELIEFDQVELPLNLNIRPDRRGVTVGSKTKEKKPPLAAQLRAKERAELPTPTPEQTTAEEERRALLAEQMRQVEARRASGK